MDFVEDWRNFAQGALEEWLMEFCQQKDLLPKGWKAGVIATEDGPVARFTAPSGKTYGSFREVSNEAAGTTECASHIREHAVEQSRAQVYGYRLPLILRNGVTVHSMGQVRAESGYCGRDRLFPLGFASVSHDPAVGQFVSEIQDGGREGPIFAVHVYPRIARGMARFTVRGADPNEPWTKLARLQSAALVELGMAPDQAPPTHILPPGFPSSSSQGSVQSLPPNCVPFHSIFAQPSNRPPLTTSTSVMNQGQDACFPKDTETTAQSQPYPSFPHVQFHQGFQTILSCVAHSICSQQSLQEYDPGPLAGLLLSTGRTLAGVWGEERFGFTSIELLEILEALPGVEGCSGYVPMTCRRGLFMEAYVTHSDAVRKMKEATWAVWELYKKIIEAKRSCTDKCLGDGGERGSSSSLEASHSAISSTSSGGGHSQQKSITCQRNPDSERNDDCAE